MIPITRTALAPDVRLALATRASRISKSPNRSKDARKEWTAARTTKDELRRELGRMVARPAFCMYCHESRGTDVDHFVPIAHDPLLTFEWPNHLLACGYCNQQAKREQFPLDDTGRALLLDPCVDDSALHMTLSTSGEFIELTERGPRTIELLRLNDRKELVAARFRSWRGIVRVFSEALTNGRDLDPDDLEDLRFLPIVDVLHHFAHDAGAGLLATKAIKPAVSRFAERNMSALRSVFPGCQL